MNNSAQVEPMPVILAFAGGILAWVMASRMNAGIFLKVITSLLTMVVGYFVAYGISNS
jgi:hypothetical protein